MSSGALLQIVSTGVQDFFLSNQPEFSYFQGGYKKYTQFAMESLPQIFSGGNPDFGRKVQCTISRSGDLVHKGHLEVQLPAMSMSSGTVAWTQEIGHVLIDEINLDIGGTIIERNFGIFYSIWNELTQVAEKADAYNIMIGNTSVLTTPATNIPAATVQIPLLFFFCQNPALALPLIAITYHTMNINITFRPANECYITSTGGVPTSGVPSLVNATLYLDYIFLSQPEREFIIANPKDMLITQLQFLGPESFATTQIRQKLNYNHPTTELIWVTQLQANTQAGANRWTDWTDSGANVVNAYAGNDPMVSGKIQINATDRIDTRSAAYFNHVLPYNWHTRCPGAGIYVYPFSLHPEDSLQPSGSINMSRIEGLSLLLTMSSANPTTVYTFARNLNILRIQKGLAGLQYASSHVTCSQEEKVQEYTPRIVEVEA